MMQIPLFRSDDPSTSRDAAARVPDFRASHEAKIYDAICKAPFGINYREIAAATLMEPVAVARRLVAMERDKLITRKRHEVTGKYESFEGCALWYRK